MILDLSRADEAWPPRGHMESLVGTDRILEQARSSQPEIGSALEVRDAAGGQLGNCWCCIWALRSRI